jgi:hypothetical protein
MALAAVLAFVLTPSMMEARVVRLRVERREVVLNGRAFGTAGPYEKLVGKVDFALDPDLPGNAAIVDSKLAPRNARGEVEFSADFYLLKPVDPRRGNGRLFYEVGNRGGKSMLVTFQHATGSLEPATEAEFGDGAMMRQGFTLLWMGWQWDVPERPGVMRMSMPIATLREPQGRPEQGRGTTENGRRITGLVRGNFILNEKSPTAPVADRNHQAYLPIDPASAESVMTVRDEPTAKGAIIPRSKWRFVNDGETGPGSTVALDGGFEPGRIYDVVYRTADPRVVGCGLAGTRDLVSFMKFDTSPENPMPGLKHALGWGVSQSGRFLRHFLYEGFNEDEQGRRVFDGVFDQVGGAGRGSFNHRFGQASRDALQYFNILFPVDLFPFTDGPQTDPDTGVTDGLLARAANTNTAPKVFHLLTNSEYFNRAGSLVHTDPTGTKDADLPPNTRIYMIASAPHGPGPFPPASNRGGGGLVGRAALNPLNYSPATRALFRALDRWVVDDVAPPASAYPKIADGTLTSPDRAGWPKVPGYELPQQPLRAFHLNFGPDWPKGIVSVEPPEIGKPFVVRVPAVDADGNVRAGIRLPDIAVPLATQAGWNYRDPSIGAPDRLAGEIGSYIPFARTRADRERARDPRPSIEERYKNRDEYVDKFKAATLDLVARGYVLAEDVDGLLEHARDHYDWAVSPAPVTLELKDYATFPITGVLDGKGQTDGMLARINSLREEPGGAARFFVNDLNGPLYILDKATKQLTTYLDFNGRGERPGIFHKFAFETGYANGLVSVQFDPDYRRNGKFYTVHIEDPAVAASNLPDNAHAPGLNVRGYEATAAIVTPGEIQREGVLVEWTDTNTSNAAFEGTARELMRVQLNTRIHPLGDLSFNPTARRGDSEWRILYIGSGDGGSGESRLAMRMNPQRLDTLVGKILRIAPDLTEHSSTSTVSGNGRYRIPNDNPFVSTPGARKEIWAVGLRNPHRLTWADGQLIVNSIGLRTWETANIIHKGANYGYSLREGNELLQPDNKTTRLPDVDKIPVLVSDTETKGEIVPTYPVIQYGHVPGGGDAIGSGFLYQGTLIPALRGKYIFTDISTGRIWYADYKEMLAADDGNPKTLAEMHEVKVQFEGRVYDSMFPVAESAYHARGGKNLHLPGRGLISGDGRADAHVAVDAAGELYIFTKTDGMLRAVVGAVPR